MFNLNLLLVLFSCICFSAFAQDTVTVEAIREQVQWEKKNFTPHPDLDRKQNDLLKAKHESKINAELTLLQPKDVITEGEMYDLVYPIFKKLLAANPSIPQDTRLVLYRSSVFNAFTMGDNVIFMHLGLLYSLANEAEIALVLAHEIAHNALKHIETSMIQAVRLETNDTLRSEMRAIARSEYGAVSAMNKLMLPRILESREVSRNHEFSADSLGMVYLKKAGFNVSMAITMFQAMEEHTENLSDSLDFEKCLSLESFPVIMEKTGSYSRGGSLGAFEKDDETWEPYLATHPYDKQRFEKLAKFEGINTDFDSYERYGDSLYRLNRAITGKALMATALKNKNLSEAIYYGCRQLLEIPGDQESYEALTATMYSLAFLKERRTAGKYLDRQNPKQAEDYDRICAFAYALSPGECQDIARKLESNLNETQTDGHPAIALIKLIGFMKAEKYEFFEPLWLSEKANIRKSDYGWILEEIENYLVTSRKVKFINPYNK